MDWSSIESALAQGLSFVQALAPLAGAGGPLAGTIGEVVGKVASFAASALQAAQAADAVISSDSLAAIEEAEATIRATNDELAAQIAAS